MSGFDFRVHWRFSDRGSREVWVAPVQMDQRGRIGRVELDRLGKTCPHQRGPADIVDEFGDLDRCRGHSPDHTWTVRSVLPFTDGELTISLAYEDDEGNVIQADLSGPTAEDSMSLSGTLDGYPMTAELEAA